MIHFEQQGFVAVVRIDRPDRRNALDKAALDGLLEAQHRAAEAETRVLVLTGSEGNFCAGADLTGVEDEAFVTLLTRVLAGFRDARYPTIAAVDGFALGAGTQLAIACDLRIANTDAFFGVPAAKLGLMVDWWTIERVASLCGQGPARLLLLTTDRMTAEQAFSWGLVQKIGGFEDAMNWARQIAELAPLSVNGLKLGLNLTESLSVEKKTGAPSAYTEAFDRAWGSRDLQEGIAAFRERRNARFQGE